MRLRIDCAYDGTDFSGWATQPGLRTVQATLEAALSTALRLPRPRVTVAGRTDSGVHARGQVAHLDVDREIVAASGGRRSEPVLETLARRVDGILPSDLRVRRVTEAPPGFDARFSATWRRYAYRIVDAQELADPLLRGHVLTWGRTLDLDAMNAASVPLVGLQDFAAFCKQREGATTVRTLLDLAWTRDERGVVVGTVRADAFCHNMVRALVGSLIAVGEGRQQVGWPAEVMAGRRRDGGVHVVRPHGLTLEEVGYPDEAEMAAQSARTRARREAIDA
ncbi:tRNA pseudouridine38-40 synthase [Nocardioides alpinus]|uniref:tRNA pseudouridine synthase A n=1 Tax=Nocardioides alpinus TaxID=748909 RepID=A0A1I0YLM1_9ACTN|nr:tRNA pseudouridine(38-40) synthase TruA [Nocardioides alpinus]PKH43599.1 tRNA pseudouridine(38-40) synthase TruA [Nocardioides alpinus]SFB14091.1 tRNA pseudouridine38-40 synthase [Nocardioides alpinus]